jgi:hypothetical protein
MQREDIKSYKDACKCISRRPRQYKDIHINTYEQLTTIIAALNFIANGNKPWYHEVYKGIKHWYVWYCSDAGNGADSGLLYLYSYYALGYACAGVGVQLRLKERDDAEYLRTNFTDLLYDWFRK